MNGSKRDPKKGIFDLKNVIFLIFQFWSLQGDPGIATLNDLPSNLLQHSQGSPFRKAPVTSGWWRAIAQGPLAVFKTERSTQRKRNSMRINQLEVLQTVVFKPCFNQESHIDPWSQYMWKSIAIHLRPRVPATEARNLIIAQSLVAQCSATPTTVAATPPCSATPFQTQISVRHLPARGGGGATPKCLGGVARHRCYTCKTL